MLAACEPIPVADAPPEGEAEAERAPGEGLPPRGIQACPTGRSAGLEPDCTPEERIAAAQAQAEAQAAAQEIARLQAAARAQAQAEARAAEVAGAQPAG